ncbi:MAG: hypothetical protein IPK25_14480 [Saprospiraceae bacterium]|nr:hypothetical protein [Saprospiraceae bacterium]
MTSISVSDDTERTVTVTDINLLIQCNYQELSVSDVKYTGDDIYWTVTKDLEVIMKAEGNGS